MRNHILIAIQRYKTTASGIVQTDLDILICQSFAKVIETDCDEITFTPIMDKGFRFVIVILQRSGDIALGNLKPVLDIAYRGSPILT